MADTSTRIFRASLRGRLYRDIELPSSGSLEDLAAAIVDAFGFDFDHAFGFYSNLGRPLPMPRSATSCSPTWARPTKA